MIRFFKRLATGGLAVAMSVAPALAGEFSPEGMWEAEDKESRYKITLCGDGTQLCVFLDWIQPDKINERNDQYIGTYMIDGAQQKGPRRWAGQTNLYGHTVNGTIKFIGDDVVKISGCAFLIICESAYATRMAVAE